ncbi:MAG: hypothetical protein P8012_16715 [Desulfobacterales bacterium]|jgi:hypothetical protein
MSLLDCPYCNKDAASYWSFGNSMYIYSKKKCASCGKAIKLKVSSIIIMMGISFIGILFAFLLTGMLMKRHLFYEQYYSLFIIIIILAWQFALPVLSGRILKINLFDIDDAGKKPVQGESR